MISPCTIGGFCCIGPKRCSSTIFLFEFRNALYLVFLFTPTRMAQGNNCVIFFLLKNARNQVLLRKGVYHEQSILLWNSERVQSGQTLWCRHRIYCHHGLPVPLPHCLRKGVRCSKVQHRRTHQDRIYLGRWNNYFWRSGRQQTIGPHPSEF